ncbi:cell division protein FtsB [Vibrio aestuarianus]|uniref:Cell division protein FtsB n=1 Tax=Vibrio aestuarianus TaxID=28171 RepID=A0ABN8TU06_9VIBR|nr:cell division protein FtsB [Vibrio aestuarianus]MDE1214867.1 cell division protein FtsB [Vibrio aestuarianus]MDE1217820.1 cell division protein FtsB [Vibrio aestuarianus]MDE1226352.1 cell division protein FtsB [Vibrio aestuarianus]MDE1257558.1 cell division protein FtsB [Vibrio aestuarianus]MDE1261971.1 cell division protein FtsB [Vibrio aestuarianus]
MRIFAVMLTLLFALLQYDLWLGKNGIADFRTILDEIEVQQQVNENLQLRNSEMFAEIDDLRQGLDAIEERARHELGMIKEGETFYRLVGEDAL